MKFFSIIIPTLNEEKYLPKLLFDLAKQHEKNFQVLIIDASSQDQTKKIAHQFDHRFPLSFFTVDKKNVSFQRNFGAQKAEGSYLIFLDADVRIGPSFTKNAQNVIEKKKGLIFIPYILPEERSSQAKVLFQLVNFVIDMSNNTGRPFSSSGSVICESDFFKVIGGFNDKLFIAEDHDLIFKALQWGVRAKCVSSIKLRFSLRRMKKEGELKMLYQYLLVSLHLIFRGNPKKKLFNYEMGGQRYEKLPLPKQAKTGNFDEFVAQFKKLFNSILYED